MIIDYCDHKIYKYIQSNMVNHHIQFKGSWLASKVLGLLGWKLIFNGLPAMRGVLVVYPHTSNWDFCIGLLAKWAIGMPVRFLAKDSLFKIPLLGSWFRYLGGFSVDRTSPQGYVNDLAMKMCEQSYCWVLFTPEGTRKYTPGWRSGFYQLSIQAQVPIGMATIDYGSKEIGILDFFSPTEDENQDLAVLRAVYTGRLGFNPHSAAPVTFWSPFKNK